MKDSEKMRLKENKVAVRIAVRCVAQSYVSVNYCERSTYFLHELRSRFVTADIGEPVLTVHRLVGGGSQHEEFMPLVGEQPRVNFNWQLKVKR